MRRTIAWTLIILGSALAGGALVMAVLELGRIYTDATDDPMGLNTPEPQDRAATTLRLAIMGIPGIFLSAVGFILLCKARVVRRSMK